MEWKYTNKFSRKGLNGSPQELPILVWIQIYGNGKVQYTFDYFNKQTSDLLLRVPIPLSVGSSENPYTNAGNVTNKGYEMSLTYNEKIETLISM